MLCDKKKSPNNLPLYEKKNLVLKWLTIFSLYLSDTSFRRVFSTYKIQLFMDIKSLFRRKSIADAIANSENLHGEGGSMVKSLTLRDLTAMGIAAVIGAGIFSTVGKACAEGGPAISVLYVFTAIACLFSALCYAEFASRVPVSGSAYTYAYTTLGEIIAWIIGWNLVFEYAIGNITVAISWSDYFSNLLEKGFHINIPDYLEMDYLTAKRAAISDPTSVAAAAWNDAPSFLGIKFIADLPTLLLTFLVTILIIRGIKESKIATNIMVGVKLVVVFLVVAIGAFYVDTSNWSPFAPNGWGNVMKGVSSVFFAYIGFDAISTTAEECKNPQRDLPRAMLYSLIICTVLYVAVVLVMTGMVKYDKLGVGDPLAFVFGERGLFWIEKIVAISAVFAMASVFLVFQIGQPRIWMTMSRDGLLPPRFAALHPKFRTPYFSSILAGFLVAIPSLFMNLTEVTDLCSIGTLFAFALVSGGILYLEKDDPSVKQVGFRIPYLNGQFIVPLLLVATLAAFIYYRPEVFTDFQGNHVLYWFFFVVFAWVAFKSFNEKWSMIPVLGLLTNLYLMTELGATNWIRFLIWCAIGLVIYFTYSYRKSNLAY
jgi:basic amino acid/polyamine antiporter, APA family